MAIGAGMTSAIMNPLHAEVKTAIMAADVLTGNDQNCAAWIRASIATADASGPVHGRRAAAARAADRRPAGPARVDPP